MQRNKRRDENEKGDGGKGRIRASMWMSSGTNLSLRCVPTILHKCRPINYGRALGVQKGQMHPGYKKEEGTFARINYYYVPFY